MRIARHFKQNEINGICISAQDIIESFRQQIRKNNSCIRLCLTKRNCYLMISRGRSRQHKYRDNQITTELTLKTWSKQIQYSKKLRQ